jgi:hypothetical protein
MSDTENKDEVDEYEQKLKFVNSIASPIASKKLVKRLYKCIKKGLNKIMLNKQFCNIWSHFCFN